MTIGPMFRLDGLVRLVDVELHAVEFLQQVVWELDVGLVDLVDEQHRALIHRERLPQLALADVVADVGDPRIAELAVAQPADGIVFVEALQRLGGGLDVPFDQRRADRFGDFDGENGLPRARFTLYQQWSLQRDGRVDGDLQVVCRHVVLRALEPHDRAQLPPAGKNRATVGKRSWASKDSRRARAARRELRPLPSGRWEWPWSGAGGRNASFERSFHGRASLRSGLLRPASGRSGRSQRA